MLSMIGGIHEIEGSPQEALRYYKEAIEVYESVRSSAGFDITKSALFSFIPDSYRDTVALYHMQGLDEDAFKVSERGRARSFLDSLVTGHIELSEDGSKGLINRELQSYENLQFVKKSLE